MNDPSSKKRPLLLRQCLGFLLSILIGMVCGALIARYMSTFAHLPLARRIFYYALLLVCCYAVFFLQIIFHEAGHLLFGLFTGYHFSSFRIGSVMFVKTEGKIRVRRLSIAGTGGQCLMIPPDWVDDQFPFVLYNLGGSLLNLLTAVGFTLISVFCRRAHAPFFSMFFALLAFVGVAFALLNGIPMRLGTVDNDGYNTLSLRKNPIALHAFWVQMKVNEQIARGVRLKDMPEEWFILPSKEGMKNSIVAAIAVFACNRLMDAHDFAQADCLMRSLLQQDTAIVGLYRRLMCCDQIYCELIGEKRSERLDMLMDAAQRKFMKSMKNFPSVLRTYYAYSLLAERDGALAHQYQEKFEKRAATYPYPADMQSERELMEYAAAQSSVNH